jgi:hypothetical protein
MYLDPGVLSMMIAAAVAAVLAIPGFFYAYRQKIKEWFNARRKRQLPRP